MKIKLLTVAAPAIFVALLTPASLHAIDAPEDNAPPPAQPAVQNAQPAAFLGIMTERLPQALREHLDVGNQEGVIITSIIPDGPADKAGLTPNEVITGIGDKKVTSPEEVSAIIANHKPNEEIRITTIRKGKPADHKITLGERPVHLNMARPIGEVQLPGLEDMPQELVDRIRRMVEENANGLEMPFAPFGELEIAPKPEIDGAIDDIRNKVENAQRHEMKFELGLGGNGLQAHREATFRMMDDQGSIELKSQEDSKEVTVRDKDNNIVWNGPWDTDQDKAAAPEDIRERLGRLNIDGKGAGLHLNLQPK